MTDSLTAARNRLTVAEAAMTELDSTLDDMTENPGRYSRAERLTAREEYRDAYRRAAEARREVGRLERGY